MRRIERPKSAGERLYPFPFLWPFTALNVNLLCMGGLPCTDTSPRVSLVNHLADERQGRSEELQEITVDELLDRYSVILLDSYGVLIHSSGALVGARELISKLNRIEKPACAFAPH